MNVGYVWHINIASVGYISVNNGHIAGIALFHTMQEISPFSTKAISHMYVLSLIMLGFPL